MRIGQLHLERYGHLTGDTLDFPPDRPLHIVLGANEAGKSTALAALADGLFGFEHRTTRDFLHPSDSLRIGFVLHDPAGPPQAFARRKGRKDTLLDGAGAALPEAALAPFLRGISRERFLSVFGLDATRLRSGGNALLREQGGAGAAILQAQTGLRGLRDVQRQLDEDAAKLHGDGRGTRAIAGSIKAIREHDTAIRDRSLNGAQYHAALKRRDEATDALARTKADLAELDRTRTRLERIRRTAPARRALTRAREELTRIGPVPSLPKDAEAARLDALNNREFAAHDRAGHADQLTRLESELAALPTDPAILAEQAEIARLVAQRVQDSSTREDRAKLEIAVATHAQSLDRLAARLGLPERGEAVRGRIPTLPARSRAEALIDNHANLAGKRETLAAQDAAAASDLAAAIDALSALPPAASSDAMRAAAATAAAEGRIDHELEQAETASSQAALTAAHRLATLPLWTGSAEALNAGTVPLASEMERLGHALQQAEATRNDATSKLADHQAKLTATQATLEGMRAAGPVPTEAAVLQRRSERDAAWAAIKAGAADATLPDRLDGLIREADTLADRRLHEAKRVTDWDRLAKEAARGTHLSPSLEAAVMQAEHAASAAQTAWEAAWAPAGIVPLDLPAMRDWLRQRHDAIEAYQDSGRAARNRDAVRARHTRVRTGLIAAGLGDAPRVEHLLHRATTQLEEASAAETRRRDAAKAVTDRTTLRNAAALNLSRIEAQLGEWSAAWQIETAALGLPAASGPVEGRAALQLWTDIDREFAALDAAQDRVSEMGAAIHGTEAALHAVATRLGVGGDDATVPALAARLAHAEQAEQARDRLTTERAGATKHLREVQTRLDQADRQLAALRNLAGAADDAALQTVIAHSVRARELASEIQEKTAELDTLGDGIDPATLDQEAAHQDPDTLDQQLATVQDQTKALTATQLEQVREQVEQQAQVQKLQTAQDVSTPALAIQDQLATIEQHAARYVRLRLAHALLHGGLDSYRRSQQGPLLQRAGALFELVTEGRYDRLELDEDDKGGAEIIAIRPEGTQCKAEFLSEGTRDQLFLALRLASIEIEAAGSPPLPFVADDLLVNFDDRRAAAALRMLAAFGATTQVILFTHHAHIAELSDPSFASLHRLPQALTT